MIYLEDVKSYLEKVQEKLFNLGDDLSEKDLKSKEQIIEICKEIIYNFGEDEI